MNLFSRENDIIKRILNLILVVWIIVTIVISYTSLVDVLFENKVEEYSYYKSKYCSGREEEDCEISYELEKIRSKELRQNDIKTLINAVGNFIIVGAFIFIINHTKEKKN